MADRIGRGLNNAELSEFLNNSEFEDDSDTGEPTYNEPEHLQESSSDSEDSLNENDEGNYYELSNARSRTRARAVNRTRTRARTRGGILGRRIGRCRTRAPIGERRSRSSTPRSFWSRNSFSKPTPVLTEPSYRPSHIGANDVYKYFEEYIDENIFELIVQKSNQSAVERTGRSLGLTTEECKIFFGITMLMACINYPHIKMHWNVRWAVPLIKEAMSRDRFCLLRNSIKLVYDNDIPSEMRTNDKLWKVRPLMDRVIEGCRKQIPSLKICIDEMIIPFTGACPIKQYCPGKPHPAGIKAFVLANPNGLVCDLVVYQGKNTMTENNHTLGEGIVIKLTEILVPGHVIFFDRYFTTFKLAETLSSMGYMCAGTIMRNRIPAYIKDEFESDRALERSGRGSHDVLVSPDGMIALTKWYDRRLRQFIQVPRPEVVKEYNASMGGVDLTDRLLAVCPAQGRTKKWTVRFVSHCFDLSITNAWVKYKEEEKEKGIRLHKIMQLREFKRVIAEKLIEENLFKENVDPDSHGRLEATEEQPAHRRRGRPTLVPLPSEIKRHHGAYHLPEYCKPSRCRNKGCSKKTTVLCMGCNIPLCFTQNRNCFKLFHTSR